MDYTASEMAERNWYTTYNTVKNTGYDSTNKFYFVAGWSKTPTNKYAPYLAGYSLTNIIAGSSTKLTTAWTAGVTEDL